MKEIELSRRDVLGGIGAIGSSGLVAGAGSVAAFSDEEGFEDGRFTAGVLDLVVEGDDGTSSADGTLTPQIELRDGRTAGETGFTLSLPGTERNNPAFPWLRVSCPPASELAGALDVTLRYDGCGDDAVIATGSLRDVANELRNGIPLSPVCDPGIEPGERDCLQPGETIGLVLEWELRAEYRGSESLSITFEFVGRQCRARDGTTNPFPTVEACPEAPAAVDASARTARASSSASPTPVGNGTDDAGNRPTDVSRTPTDVSRTPTEGGEGA